MPELVKLYIRNVAIGFGIAAVFVALLLWFNVANLQHLIFNTQGGWLALFLLVMFNGIVFAGVQFAIAVMSMAEDGSPSGGKPEAARPVLSWFKAVEPVKIPVEEPRR